ncbi:MAG: AAA family ATPase [Candidatus Margulisiibacteriota bacterium]
MLKKRTLLAVLTVFACLGAQTCFFGDTVEDLYQSASNKYFVGDNTGAVLDLKTILRIDPGNTKAVGLLNQIVNEGKGVERPKEIIAAPPVRKSEPTRRVAPKRESIRRSQILPPHRDIVEPRNVSAEERSFVEQLSFWSFIFYLAVVWGVLTLFGLVTYYLFSNFGHLVNLSWIISKFRKEKIKCYECNKLNPSHAEFCLFCGTRLNISKLTEKQSSWFEMMNWKKNPFSLSIIPDTFAGHKLDISIIMQKLSARSGHVLIIGGLGAGKSTLLRWLENNLKNPFYPIYIIRPPEQAGEVINMVAATLLGRTQRTNQYSLLDLQRVCKKCDKTVVLLIDEAHECTQDFEQFLRSIGDYYNVYLVMAGISQTREKFKREMPALFDRIVETVWLGSLSLEETKELICKRIADAGGQGSFPFTQAAIEKIFELSHGIPREILKICDLVVTNSMDKNLTIIDRDDVKVFNVAEGHLFGKPEGKSGSADA